MAPLELKTYYTVLGVGEQATQEDIKEAYRQRALILHPDKGGDEAEFAKLARAYQVLSDPAAKETYDGEIWKARERAALVEGGRDQIAAEKGVLFGTHCDNPATKQAQAPMARQKTAPTEGSKRTRGHCAHEWKGIIASGMVAYKAIEDYVPPEQKTQILLDKYSTLPRNKEKRQKWANSLGGNERCNLKAAAKEKEAKELAKWQSGWLAQGPKIKESFRKQEEAAKKEKLKAAAAASKARTAAAAAEAAAAADSAEAAGVADSAEGEAAAGAEETVVEADAALQTEMAGMALTA